jgi:hypothetical protein
MLDQRVEIVSRALHTFHGIGYCTMGKHISGMNFHCYDEARAILAALDGGDTAPYRDPKATLTLSAREKASKK